MSMSNARVSRCYFVNRSPPGRPEVFTFLSVGQVHLSSEIWYRLHAKGAIAYGTNRLNRLKPNDGHTQRVRRG